MLKQFLPKLLGCCVCASACLQLRAQTLEALNITPLPAESKAQATHVRLTGTLTTTGNSDFRQLRDLCYRLASLDLSAASCPQLPDNALHSRHRLKRLLLPQDVHIIGSQAFFACDSLRGTLLIPASVTTIGDRAFAQCASLDTLCFAPESRLTGLNAYAFAGCSALVAPLALPDGLTSLADGTFYGCRRLPHVTLPRGLRQIGTNAFAGCASLAGTLVLNSELTSIGASAFDGCTSLVRIEWPKGLRQIGAAAFHGCTSLGADLALPGSLTVLGEGAFADCQGLESVVLPASVDTLRAATFAGCTHLRTLTLCATIPPRLDATALLGVDRKLLQVYVPKGCKRTYKKSEAWKDFHIVEGDFEALPHTTATQPDAPRQATTAGLIPVPAKVKPTVGRPLVWTTIGGIDAPRELENERQHAERILRERAGVTLATSKGENRIRLALTDSLSDDEAYTLVVDAHGIDIHARIVEIGGIADPSAPSPLSGLPDLSGKPFPVIDDEAGQRMIAAIEEARRTLNSRGGIIEVRATGLPADIGSPFFDRVESRLGEMFFSLNAVRGVEFGDGFAAARARGSENNDPPAPAPDGTLEHVGRISNHAGGVEGGITTGLPLIARLAFKPTPSISSEQTSVDLETNQSAPLVVRGRHDPCIVVRAVPVVESAMAFALLDLLLEHGWLLPESF